LKKNTNNQGGVESNDFPPEGKFLKKGWSSRDEQRWNRKSLKRATRRSLNKLRDEWNPEEDKQIPKV